MDILGKSFDQIFGADMTYLDSLPGRVVSVRRDQGPMLDRWRRAPIANKRPHAGCPNLAHARHRAAPTWQDLARGSHRMQSICTQVRRSYDLGLPILIEGETGTGKTALIRALLGDDTQVVTIAGASFDDTQDNRGYIQSLMKQASIAQSAQWGGQTHALVFDNIDELPHFAQSALREALDALGSAQDNGVHILATSRRPLRMAIEDGRFRDDLYYLLSGAAVQLPPLRAREKPMAIAEAIARQLAGREVTFTPEAQQAIAQANWPGNLRELRSALQQALLQGDAKRIGAFDLGQYCQPLPLVSQTLLRPKAHDEKQLLLDALQSARWNASKAARSLGIGRATIHRKMKDYGISRPN